MLPSPPACGRGLRGGPVLQRTANHLKNAVHVLHHVIVPEADHPIALGLEKRRSCRVAMVFGMLSAINLDNQLLLAAEKVGDERPDWHLAREFEPVELTAAQMSPEEALGIGRAISELLSASGGTRPKRCH